MTTRGDTPRALWSVSLHPLLILSALLALAYGLASPPLYAAGAWPYAMAIFKMSSIALLALIAAMVHARLLTWALVMGAAGDVGLALGESSFLAGAVCFLIGHLCYIRLFVRHRDRANWRAPWRILAIAVIAGAAFGMTYLLVPADNDLATPLSVYTGVLTLMTMSSFLLPVRYRLAIYGASLFFISDGFVAANMFHRAADPALAYWLSVSGWMIYWAGQAALCFGARRLHNPAHFP